MIQPTELRLGNKLLFDKQIVSVEGISRDLNDEPYDIEIELPDGMFATIQIEDLETIPMSNEWLKKFGFERNLLWQALSEGAPYDSYEIKVGDYTRYVVLSDLHRPGKEGKFNWYTGANAVCHAIELKYVHQLQNIYYCFTGKELELS